MIVVMVVASRRVATPVLISFSRVFSASFLLRTFTRHIISRRKHASGYISISSDHFLFSLLSRSHLYVYFRMRVTWVESLVVFSHIITQIYEESDIIALHVVFNNFPPKFGLFYC